MKKPAAPPRALVRAFAAAAAFVVLTASAQASDPVTTVLDRTNSEPVDVPPRTERAQDRLRSKLGGTAVLETDPVTGTPRVVARLDGFLTPSSSRDAETIALGYVRDHAVAFGVDADDLAGLRLTDSERGPDGTTHLSWEQRADGLPNVDGGLQAAVNADGRLVNVRGGVVPDLDRDAPEPLVSAAAAYAAALPGSASPPPASSPSGPDRETSFAGGGTASLVRYQDDGTDRLGWRLLVPGGSDAFYDAIVDARTGTLQRRINRVRFASQINHFNVNPRAEDGEFTTSIVPADWLDPGTDRLKGPYVHAVSDLDDSIDLADGGPPFTLTEEPAAEDEVLSTSPPEEEPQWQFTPVFGPAFTFCEPLCTWKGSNRVQNREFSTAQLFWYLNTFHDHLEMPPIGFNSESGAFEGSDPVLAQSLDGVNTQNSNPDLNLPDDEHLSNASMLTLPDGNRGLMQVNLFALFRRYDGAHDAGLVYHEYTHGLTDRLVTDEEGFATLFGAQPGALAEGFSDFYAQDFLAETQAGDVPDTPVPGEVWFGEWLHKEPDRLVRTEGLDCPVGDPAAFTACPGTPSAGQGGYDYRDFGRINTAIPDEVHDNGEIWGQTLWSIRQAIAGDDPTAAELARVRQYVTSGLRLVPEDATFIDMRNAILQAAFVADAGEELTTLWQVFASRGMGWSASTAGVDDIAPDAAFDMPPPVVVPPPPPDGGGGGGTGGGGTGGGGTGGGGTGGGGTTTQPPPPGPLVTLADAKLKASRKGMFKVNAVFGSTAPIGNARFKVALGKKRLAKGATPVRPGRTVVKTLRLSKKGRKAIKPGRSKNVKLQLLLPSGEKFEKTLKLKRKKR